MTRVNLIPVEMLTKQHLLAEHREIKRIPNVIKKGKYNLDNIPEQYTMGTGHVKFFYNKLAWLCARYIALYNECVRRNLNVQFYGDVFIDLPKELFNSWKPSFDDIVISQQRINEKLAMKPKFYTY